ncbi:hypothetical protein HNP38_000131 [Chryseobacterium defluvii]|uniref:T9SS C-terminal target domain-containing protein n=1 Tax=Chryseobacterium defluvii TaxID=160396 RepID=A0A840K6M1_9FLAO|nr:hypothetical protein [Chryseobacterium defluvii]MBB4804859.1 hypothetical protein [Chryseobacterium defluvii]
MKKLLFFAVIISQSVFSQETDFLKIKKYKVSYLDDKIRETSGLNLFKNRLYTFNDSGNTPELFEIDKGSGNIISVMKINASNTDWEALANDGEHFYIGDFGNNLGTRKDLKIFKIPFQKENLTIDPAATISFYYPEQTDFTPKNTDTDFDVEAMIWLNGKLHLFTKEWASKATTHYIIDPEISENQKAQKAETYKTGFVVTDAAYFAQKLYLIGYTKKTEVFLDIFDETEPGIFFNSSPKHYYLGSSLSIGQIEGIAVNEDGIYISGEKFNSPLGSTKQGLYFIPSDKNKPGK